MSIHLISGEKILWQSGAGKRYRTFVLFRDLFFTTLMAILFHHLFSSVPAIVSLVGNQNVLMVSILIGIAGVIFALFHQASFLFTTYYVTNERTIIQRGFISRDVKAIKHEHVHDTQKKQSIRDRLLGCGTIRLFTANDSRNTKDPYTRIPTIENIDNPDYVDQLIHEWLEENLKRNKN